MSPPPNPPDQEDAHYRAILQTLVDQAAALATHLHAQTLAATPEEAPPLAAAFERAARTVRRTIALARHIAATPDQAQNHATARRASVIRGVEDAIHRTALRRGAPGSCDNPPNTTQLLRELAETLEDPALEFDLASRPTAEIIEEIARDLGINTSIRSFIFKRRTPADRTALQTQAQTRAQTQTQTRAAILPPSLQGRGRGWVCQQPAPPPTAPNPTAPNPTG